MHLVYLPNGKTVSIPAHYTKEQGVAMLQKTFTTNEADYAQTEVLKAE